MDALTTDLTIAPSQLAVHNLDVMRGFYGQQVGLSVLEQTASRALLGYDHIPVIELVRREKLLQAPPTTAGLFHNAVLFDTRGALSESVTRLLHDSPALFQGTGDHLVSEAFYFSDPEGNGLELYHDRPRTDWAWTDGQVQMDTLYIDPLAFLRAYSDEKPQDRTSRLGHVHLRVGDTARAQQFYVGMLGFTVTALVPQALFVSVGGYHHHVGLNTWMSRGAGLRSPALGLSGVTFHLASEADLAQLAIRLERSEWPFSYRGGLLKTADPWGNELRFDAA